MKEVETEVGGEVEGNEEVEEFLKNKNKNGYIGLKQFY